MPTFRVQASIWVTASDEEDAKSEVGSEMEELTQNLDTKWLSYQVFDAEATTT